MAAIAIARRSREDAQSLTSVSGSYVSGGWILLNHSTTAALGEEGVGFYWVSLSLVTTGMGMLR